MRLSMEKSLLEQMTIEQFRQNLALLKAEEIEMPKKWVLELLNTIEALQQENEQLRAQVGKPTIEQVAWIAKCICQNADEQGTFRHLIYDIMGYSGEAYQPLCEAGLLRINNSMTELTPEQVEALQQENEQLRAQLDEWKYEVKCHMDEVTARDKEIDQLQAKLDQAAKCLNNATKYKGKLVSQLADKDELISALTADKDELAGRLMKYDSSIKQAIKWLTPHPSDGSRAVEKARLHLITLLGGKEDE